MNSCQLSVIRYQLSVMNPDLSPYAGRWVALANEQVAGVGHSADEALHMGRRSQPKARLVLQFVDAVEGERLLLPELLGELRPYLMQSGQPIYLVGGAVRDALLGRLTNDLDFVLPHDAITLTFRIADAIKAPAYVLDRERDTGRIVLPEVHTYLDFARFRGGTLEEDLHDRDFTINAMALPATATLAESIIDPYNGRSDLTARTIRLVNENALARDPVRTLRALRLALSLDFAIAPETRTAVSQSAPLLQNVSIERIRDEWAKMLATAVPDQALQQMHTLNLTPIVIPEVEKLVGVQQSAPHHEEVFDHTVSVLRWLVQVEACLQDDPPAGETMQHLQQQLAPFAANLNGHLARETEGKLNGRLLLRLGAVFHDVGKAETQTVEENGRIRFIGHDKVGAKLAARRLSALRFSNVCVRHVGKIVQGHMRPLLLATAGSSASRRTIFRYFRDLELAGIDVALLSLADHLATHNGVGADAHVWQNLVQIVTQLLQTYFAEHPQTISPTPLLNGRFIMQELKISPGPEIGRIIRLLQEAQAAGEVTTQEEAIHFIHKIRQ